MLSDLQTFLAVGGDALSSADLAAWQVMGESGVSSRQSGWMTVLSSEITKSL